MSYTDAQKLSILRSSLRTSDMVHTCKSKEEATKWVELQSSGDPLASVYFQAGFNFAIDQVRQILDGTHPSMQEKETTS